MKTKFDVYKKCVKINWKWDGKNENESFSKCLSSRKFLKIIIFKKYWQVLGLSWKFLRILDKFSRAYKARKWTITKVLLRSLFSIDEGILSCDRDRQLVIIVVGVTVLLVVLLIPGIMITMRDRRSRAGKQYSKPNSNQAFDGSLCYPHQSRNIYMDKYIAGKRYVDSRIQG